MARKKSLGDSKAIVKALLTIGTENEVSRFHKMQLIGLGHLEAVKAPEEKKVSGSRGRMPHRYVLTKKAENLIRLSKSWAKNSKPENSETENLITS